MTVLGGEEVGGAYVDIHLDDDSLPAEVKAAATRASRAATVKVKAEVDTSTFRAGVTRAFSGIKAPDLFAGFGSSSSLGQVQFGLLKIAAAATTALGAITPLGAGVAGLAAGFVAVTASIAAAAPAVLAFGPTLGAIGLAAGVATLALKGFTDAVEAKAAAEAEMAATGKVSEATQKKLAETYGRLSENAQDLVRALLAAKPAFTDFRQALQDALLDDTADAFRGVIDNLLPTLQERLTRTAELVGDVGDRFLEWAGSEEGVRRIDRLLAGLNRVLRPLLDAVSSFGAGFLSVFEALLGPGTRLADTIADIGDRFATWAEGVNQSGALADTVERAMDRAATLLSILGNIGSILGSVFGAGLDAGDDLLQRFDDLTERLATFLETAEAQAGLSTFFDTISKVGQVVSDLGSAFGPAVSGLVGLLDALGPVLDDLRDALLPLVEAFSGGIGAALEAATPFIVAAADAFVSLLEAIPPDVAAALGTAALAVAVGIKAIAVAGALLAAANPAVLIAALVAALIIAYQRSQEFRDIVSTAFASVKDAVAEVVRFFDEEVRPAVDRLGDSFDSVRERLQPTIDRLQQIAEDNLPQIKEVFRDVWETIQVIVLGAIDAIGALLERGADLWDIFGDTILDTVEKVFPAILDTIQGVLDVIQGIVQTFTSVLRGDWSGAWEGLKDIAFGALDALGGLIRTALGVVQGIVKLALDPIQALFTNIWGKVQEAWVSGVNALIGILNSAIGQINDALSFTINTPTGKIEIGTSIPTIDPIGGGGGGGPAPAPGVPRSPRGADGAGGPSARSPLAAEQGNTYVDTVLVWDGGDFQRRVAERGVLAGHGGRRVEVATAS